MPSKPLRTEPNDGRSVRLYSIGHGARALDEFIELLREAGVGVLADIRTAPRSRLHPHFDGSTLSRALGDVGVEYRHLAGLGGWRRSRPASPHVALRTPGFRGYADHQESPEFLRDYAELLVLARTVATAFMCAETLWWRCHRRILSDRLVADGIEVVHLARPGSREPHRLSKFARIADGRLIYDVVEPSGEREGEAVLASRS